MKLRATKTAGGWTLNGNKCWITNSEEASTLLVYAVTDPEAAPGKRLTTFM